MIGLRLMGMIGGCNSAPAYTAEELTQVAKDYAIWASTGSVGSDALLNSEQLKAIDVAMEDGVLNQYDDFKLNKAGYDAGTLGVIGDSYTYRKTVFSDAQIESLRTLDTRVSEAVVDEVIAKDLSVEEARQFMNSSRFSNVLVAIDLYPADKIHELAVDQMERLLAVMVIDQLNLRRNTSSLHSVNHVLDTKYSDTAKMLYHANPSTYLYAYTRLSLPPQTLNEIDGFSDTVRQLPVSIPD